MDINERAGKALAGRWRAGMKVADRGLRLFYVDDESYNATDDGGFTYAGPLSELRSADVENDPATRGAFLDVVREAWGDPAAYVIRDAGCKVERQWGLYLCDGAPSQFEPPDNTCVAVGATEAEALVAALEAAPAR